MHKLLLSMFIVLVLPLGCIVSCKRTETSSANSAGSSPAAKIDACSLITKEEVGAVQNTTITDTKDSENSDGRHLITQCYYAATGPNLSVSLALTQPSSSGGSTSSPRNYWEEIFAPYRGSDKKEELGEEDREKRESLAKQRGEDEEKKTPPKKIGGVGDEAFWSGSKVGGALYVLHKNYILRISVGGPDTEEVKITKSKSLAQKALQRL